MRVLFSGSSMVPVLSRGCWWIMLYRSDAVHSICISHKRKSQADTGFNQEGLDSIFRKGPSLQSCCQLDILIIFVEPSDQFNGFINLLEQPLKERILLTESTATAQKSVC